MSSAPVPPAKTIAKPAARWPVYLLGGIVVTSLYHGYVAGSHRASEKLNLEGHTTQRLADIDITKVVANTPYIKIPFIGSIEAAYFSPFILLFVHFRDENHRKKLAKEKK